MKASIPFRPFYLFIGVLLLLDSCSREETKGKRSEVPESKHEDTLNKIENITTGQMVPPFQLMIDVKGIMRLRMTPEFKILLDKWNRFFKTYRYEDFVATCSGSPDYFRYPNPPFAVIDDFNEDGFPDLILYGFDSISRKETILVGCISQNALDSIQIMEIETWDYQNPADDYLDSPENKGLYTYIYLADTTHFKREGIRAKKGFIFEYCEKAATTYYWKGNRLVSITTAD